MFLILLDSYVSMSCVLKFTAFFNGWPWLYYINKDINVHRCSSQSYKKRVTWFFTEFIIVYHFCSRFCYIFTLWQWICHQAIDQLLSYVQRNINPIDSSDFFTEILVAILEDSVATPLICHHFVYYLLGVSMSANETLCMFYLYMVYGCHNI